jgi:hypothetical protein
MNYDRLNKMTKKQMYAFIANLVNVGFFQDEGEEE